MLLSVVTFSANDPSLNHVVSRQAEVSNQAGLFGAYTAGFLNDVFGIGAYIWPLVFGALGASCVSPAYTISWWRWCGLFLLTICLLVVGAAWDLSLGDIAGGGMIGGTLHSNSSYYLSPGGSGLVWFFIFLVGVQLTFNFSWFSVGALYIARIRERILQKKQDEEHKPEIVTHGQELASLPFHKRILAGLKQKTPGKGSDFWRALRDKLAEACKAAAGEGVVEIANYNCPGQLVIGGQKAAVDAAAAKAKEMGAKRCLPLKVSGPFHTSLLRPAGDALRERFKTESFGEMAFPVLFNCLGREMGEGDTIPALLERQVQSSVYMEDTIRRLAELGVDLVVEIGPGKVLSGFVKKTAPALKTCAVETCADIDALCALLKEEE